MVEGQLRGVLPSDRGRVEHSEDSGNRIFEIGDIVPDFRLPSLAAGVKQNFHLRAYRGQKSVVLAFYPFNWQEVSARQISEYQAQRERVLAANAEVVAITVDSIMNVTAWEREIGPIDFPLCSDFWPHGEVSALYGVLEESGPNAGAAKRSVFIVDRDGRLAFRKTYPEDSAPSMEDILQVLERLA